MNLMFKTILRTFGAAAIVGATYTALNSYREHLARLENLDEGLHIIRQEMNEIAYSEHDAVYTHLYLTMLAAEVNNIDTSAATYTITENGLQVDRKPLPDEDPHGDDLDELQRFVEVLNGVPEYDPGDSEGAQDDEDDDEDQR